jgi:copper(I)-binding protein
MQRIGTIALALLALTSGVAAHAAGRLVVGGAWIRTAPPGAMMLAGYATLRNAGDAPIRVRGASSDAFGAVSLHETVETGGVEHMRALGGIDIAPGDSVRLAPGGKHLMLMRPARELAAGARLEIHFDADSGNGTNAEFVVRDDAPGAH